MSPFVAHLVVVDSKDPSNSSGQAVNAARKEAERLYAVLSGKGIEVLYDDRDARAGEKFADSDLMGISYRVVVSDKTIAAGGYEVKHRASGSTESLAENDLTTRLQGINR